MAAVAHTSVRDEFAVIRYETRTSSCGMTIAMTRLALHGCISPRLRQHKIRSRTAIPMRPAASTCHLWLCQSMP